MAEDERRVEPPPEMPGVEEPPARFEGPTVQSRQQRIDALIDDTLTRYAEALRELAK
jgi:hypothetical protein